MKDISFSMQMLMLFHSRIAVLKILKSCHPVLFAFLLEFVHAQPLDLPAYAEPALIGGRELPLAFRYIRKAVEVFQMPRFVQQLTSVVLSVDVQQPCAQCAQLLDRHGHAADVTQGVFRNS